MKINAIKTICKDAKRCVIYETGGMRQWIGTEEAIYPADALTLDKSSVDVLFDMKDAGEKMQVDLRPISESGLQPISGEEEWNRWEMMSSRMLFDFLGEAVYLLTANGRLYLARRELIRAAVGSREYRVYRLAHNGKGEPLIVIDDGMLTVGIIRPMPAGTADIVRSVLEELGRMTAAGSPDKDERRNADEERHEPDEKQVDMFTGEEE